MTLKSKIESQEKIIKTYELQFQKYEKMRQEFEYIEFKHECLTETINENVDDDNLRDKIYNKYFEKIGK